MVPPEAGRLERASCGVCGADRAGILFRAADASAVMPGATYPVGRCLDCGHAYVLERPPEAEIGRYYPADYAAHRSHADEGPRRGSRRFHGLRRPPPFRILDVGCGSGYDLLRWVREGCAASGIEADPAAAAEARRHGIDVLNCSVPQAGFPDASFDVVTMFHVVEHLHDPRAALRNLRRMIRPGGELFAAFPTAEGLLFSWFREHWHHLDVPRHLQFFTHASFSRLAREAGFRVAWRGCRSGARSLRRSFAASGNRIAARALSLKPARWLTRIAVRYVVDGLRLGDVAEYLLRPSPA
jgi:SAM-dependent methyltransferase